MKLRLTGIKTEAKHSS